mgnify:CR=1 FL=1
MTEEYSLDRKYLQSFAEADYILIGDVTDKRVNDNHVSQLTLKVRRSQMETPSFFTFWRKEITFEVPPTLVTSRELRTGDRITLVAQRFQAQENEGVTGKVTAIQNATQNSTYVTG